MVFPPRPGEGLLFGEIPVLGETGDPVRRNRGFKLDAWHDWFPLRTAIHGRASTCEPSPVKPAHESETLAQRPADHEPRRPGSRHSSRSPCPETASPAAAAYSASAASPTMSSAIESGLSPDTGLNFLPRGGFYATRVELRRAPLNLSEPFGAEGRPVLRVLVVPNRVNEPQPFCRAERPRGIYDFLKRGHGHCLSVTGFHEFVRHPDRVQGGGEDVRAARLRPGLGLRPRSQKLPRPEPRRGDLPDSLCHGGPAGRCPMEAAPSRRRPSAVSLLGCRARPCDPPGVGGFTLFCPRHAAGLGRLA